MTSKSTNFITYLKHPVTYMLVVCMILVWTTYHSLQVYLSLFPQASTIERIWVIIGLIAIDASVVLFTVNKAQVAAGLYGLLIFILNLFVFWKGLSLPNSPDLTAFLPFLPGFLYAGAISFSLYTFTELFVRYDEARELAKAEENTISHWKHLARQKEKALSDLESKFSVLRQSFSELEKSAVPMETHRETADILNAALEKLVHYEEKALSSPESLRKGAAYHRKKAEKMDPGDPKRAGHLLMVRVNEWVS